MTQRLCRCCDGWHEMGNPWPRECIGHFKVRTTSRSDLPRPMVISDDVDVSSPVSGERFTSKSHLRRHYRDNGVVEVGNEVMKQRDRDDGPDVTADVAKAFDEVG